MLSAFQLTDCRLSRLELDEGDKLASSVWVDLVEPEDEERERVHDELGQSLATRPELDDIEASARFFEDEDGLHIHSFFIMKMPKIAAVTPPWPLLFGTVACLPCASGISRVSSLPHARPQSGHD